MKFHPYDPQEIGYVPAVYYMKQAKFYAVFEKSPKPGDLIYFRWTENDFDNNEIVEKKHSGLCTKEWKSAADHGEFLGESGDVYGFTKAEAKNGDELSNSLHIYESRV